MQSEVISHYREIRKENRKLLRQMQAKEKQLEKKIEEGELAVARLKHNECVTYNADTAVLLAFSEDMLKTEETLFSHWEDFYDFQRSQLHEQYTYNKLKLDAKKRLVQALAKMVDFEQEDSENTEEMEEIEYKLRLYIIQILFVYMYN
jgi:septal ring factor EnvC (AmiA/AmiB activator)